MQQISYTAVLLDDRSRAMLAQHFKKEAPDGWKWFCHHMTITMGALPEESREAMLGKQVTITAVSAGVDEMAMAVGVTGFYSKNKRPHVTLAINIDGGGKPMMSNNIPDENWEKLPEPITLTGVVTEFPMPEKKSLTEGYDVNGLPFFNDIRQLGGKIYQVGGAVRDLYLGKDSKDLDILITGVPADKLDAVLRKYGKVDMVGASFGVIKFTPPGGEEIDIAIPRTERKTGAGYQGFEVTSDHTLPIEKDLERRDFTINSIAKDSDGNIIDPFDGVKDLDAKLIRVTNPAAFGDDPLRMLRAVQFASRFEFKIEPKTFQMIQKNAPSIAEISKERVLIEFDKIVEKGDPKTGAELLIASGLYKGIFGQEFKGEMAHFSYVTRMSEFVYWLIESFTDKPDQYFKNVMKGEDKIAREIAALAYLYHNLPGNDKVKQRWMYFNLNKITPAAFESEFVLSLLHEVTDDFKHGKYPASLKHLVVDGNDLLTMGFKGKEIGSVLSQVVGEIFADHLQNDRTAITQFLKKKVMIQEQTIKDDETVYFFDFDGTLMDSPMPTDANKKQYQKVRGREYPHKGWWSKAESLDMEIYNIQPHAEIEKVFRSAHDNPQHHAVLLTNRIYMVEKEIRKVLDKHRMYFEQYSFKATNDNKGQRILSIMQKSYPHIKNIVFFDDDQKHLDDTKAALAGQGYNLRLVKIKSDATYLTQDTEVV